MPCAGQEKASYHGMTLLGQDCKSSSLCNVNSVANPTVQRRQELRRGSMGQNTVVVRWCSVMVSLLLGDPLADLAAPWGAVQAMLVGQEARSSPGPALLPEEGPPFAVRIVLSEREEGKFLPVRLKRASGPPQLTWVVSQDGVILVTGPDPVLHVGDTLPPKPPAFVTHLEAGEKHSSKKPPDSPASSPGVSQPCKADLQPLTTMAGHVPVTAHPYTAARLLRLLQRASNPLTLQGLQKAAMSPSKPMETWCHPLDVQTPTHLPAADLEDTVALLPLETDALLTSKLSSAFTIQQSVHVARSRKRVESRARPNAVICKAALMGLPARAQRRWPPLRWPLPGYLICEGLSARVSSGVLGVIWAPFHGPRCCQHGLIPLAEFGPPGLVQAGPPGMPSFCRGDRRAGGCSLDLLCSKQTT